MATTTISMTEAKNFLNYAIDTNLALQEEGKMPIAVSFEAQAGIGKTSMVEQVATERNMNLTKVCLHQMEEAGDLIGFPQVEYECQVGQLYKNEKGETKVKVLPDTVWLNAKQMEAPQAGVKYRHTGKTRMGYAKPAWVPSYHENGNIVLLDDYVRANPQLLQACMELILTQKYTSWSFPKKTILVLTNNPDDGQSNVNSLDEAQRTRFLNYEVGFDIDAWGKWAEEAKLDNRCINFVITYYNELFNANEDGERICNPRSFVMFANMISGIKDWDTPDNLAMISLVAKGCFKDEGSRFASMFTSFIRNKMHLLISPKDMLLGGWDRVRPLLENTMYDTDGNFRPDLASLLERRFSNYVHAWLGSEEDTPIKKVTDRILDFINNEEKLNKRLFPKDVMFHMIKSITSDHKRQTMRILAEPRIAKIIS